MKIRQGKDIILKWKIATNGEALPLEGRNLTLILSTPNGRERVLSYTTEGDTISARLFGKETTLLGDYTLTLWENKGEQGQTAVDAVNAFELVKYSTMEEDGSPCGNLEAEVLSLSGDLGVFQQGTTTEKNEQVDKNTADIADIKQGMGEVQDGVNAINTTLDKLGKDNDLVQADIANIKDKDAEQDEEITSLLNILDGKLDIKDLGSGLRPDQAVSEIIQYVRSNEIKSALVFKYIDTDNSSTFGICISRTGTSGWIIYLVARKGLEVLKFNSRGSRETWNEYGGVLRHDMNSVADEQLECLSIKGIKSVLATKQNALISGQNIKTINGQSIMGSGDIEIQPGITEEEKKELNNKIDTKAPKVGYAPDLKVSYAKELVGRGEATEQVIGGIRPTGEISIGDGNATIERIKGRSVVWNQLVDGAIFFTLMSTQDNITYVPTKATAGGNIYHVLGVAKGSHKYLCTGTITNSLGVVPKAGKVPLGTVFSFENEEKMYLSPITGGVTVSTDDWVRIDEPIQFYDLTLMFGAGNEPTTIEDFEARKPVGVSNEYNEGTIISYNGDALKSVGFNAWDEEWAVGAVTTTGYDWPEKTTSIRTNYIPVVPNQTYEISYPSRVTTLQGVMYDKDKQVIAGSAFFGKEITTLPECHYIKVSWIDYLTSDIKDYQHDICIHLTHSGYRNGEYQPYETDTHVLPDVKSILDANGNQLFPYGLLSAGSVYDEITATKAIKRIGVVDMGDLTWRLNDEFGGYDAILETWKENDNNRRLLTSKYSYKHHGYLESDDKVICAIYYHQIFVRDSSYTSVTDFKQAMSGVLLYYELAEPIEVDLPEPLNMTYEAWDFGTEELVAKGATTPLNADIVYQFNAVDRIRENSSAIDDLEEHVEEHKNDGIELLTNGNLKLTLKGETREFMPATPSGDPMHWAYVSAGAEYNDSGEDIVKDAPWAALADTDEEKKVTHKAGCWYLNGVGDMTNDDIRYSYTNKTLLYALNKRASCSNDTTIRTMYSARRGSVVSGLGPTKASTFFGCTKLETCLFSDMAKALREPDYSLSLSTHVFYNCSALKAIGQVTLTSADINTFIGCRSLQYILVYALKVSINLQNSSLISKLSIKYMIDNATPTSAITITLHADAYARLVDDTEIKTALETKNAALEGTGGSISLVSV